MPRGRLVFDVAIFTAAMATLAFPFGIVLFLESVPWPIRAVMLGSSALASLIVLLIVLWTMPVRYSVEGGVVKLCSPVRCVEYVVEGVEEGKVHNPRRWKEWFPCFGFRGFRLAWAKCANDQLYFATARCRDVWKKLQVRKGNERYTLWLCVDSRGGG